MNAALDRWLTRLYRAVGGAVFLALCGSAAYTAGDRAGARKPEAATPIHDAFSARARDSATMRTPISLAALCLTAAALAAGGLGLAAEDTQGAVPLVAPPAGALPKAEECLSPADMREEVSEHRVIAPVAAIRAARSVIPRAEIQRASLCRHETGLVYMLTALRRDGHFVHVMVDARTGQVAGQY